VVEFHVENPRSLLRMLSTKPLGAMRKHQRPGVTATLQGSELQTAITQGGIRKMCIWHEPYTARPKQIMTLKRMSLSPEPWSADGCSVPGHVRQVSE
jgi:hypothetical protein